MSGGEPLLDEKLIEKLEYIRTAMKTTFISLSTNAAVKYNFNKLKGLVDCIDISIPSLNASVYSKMRGMNCISIVKSNIQSCIECGFDVRVSCILTKLNKASIIGVLDFAEQKGVKSVRLGRYLPLRNANKCRDDYELNEDEIQVILSNVNKKKFSFKIIPPIGSLALIKSGYISIDYEGNLFLPNEDGKDVVINALKYKGDDLMCKIKELGINNIQPQIFSGLGQNKFGFKKYFKHNRIRSTNEYNMTII